MRVDIARIDGRQRVVLQPTVELTTYNAVEGDALSLTRADVEATRVLAEKLRAALSIRSS